LSAGSKYYENAEKRDEKLEKRIEEMRKAVRNTSGSEMRAYEEAMRSFIGHVEAHERDLTKVWMVVDNDAFYAKCEERANPALNGKAFAVGSIGMICTSSYEARKFGVRSAQPGFVAKALCPQLIFVPPDFTKYTAAAEECRAVYRQYDPHFSAMSLDEAYMDLTPYCTEHGILASAELEHSSSQTDEEQPEQAAHSSSSSSSSSSSAASERYADYASAAAGITRGKRKANQDDTAQQHIPSPSEQQAIAALVHKIRTEVKESTRGLTCSAGIGPNPLLAKIASNDNKPDGQTLVPFDRESILAYMRALSVRSLPGVGKVMEQILKDLNLNTCADIIDKCGLVRAAFNERTTHWLIRSALGIAPTHRDKPIDGAESDTVSRKSISQERTFRDCSDQAVLKAKAKELSESVAASMSDEGIVGDTVTVKMKLHTFEVLQRSQHLHKPTNDPELIANTAIALLTAAGFVKLRLLGVRMSGLTKIVTKPTMLDSFVAKGSGSSGTSRGSSGSSSSSAAAASALGPASSASPARIPSSNKPAAQSATGMMKFLKRSSITAVPPEILVLDDDDDELAVLIDDDDDNCEGGECAPAAVCNEDEEDVELQLDAIGLAGSQSRASQQGSEGAVDLTASASQDVEVVQSSRAPSSAAASARESSSSSAGKRANPFAAAAASSPASKQRAIPCPICGRPLPAGQVAATAHVESCLGETGPAASSASSAAASSSAAQPKKGDLRFAFAAQSGK
jgi:DNA polymerase kappa